MLTEEKEDYLKAILTNDGDVSFVSNKQLSQFLNIKPPSVSEMIGRLEKEGYVETKHYKGACLTKEGLDRTLDIIKRHRLLELFLIEILQYNWEEVHQEAEILEHRISDLFVERLDKTLNFPKTCPHGGVIPRDHHYKELYTTSILEFEPGDNVIVKRVRDKTDLLVYLSSKDIYIGNTVEIVSKDDTNKVIIIKRNENVTILSYENAMNIFAEKQ
ncbi:metal-dependent transcriptional regulator [Staphylococcus capitis]|uniref:metal-dependent transcriptional regulator n=1 Tax=Staphylococcus capitis TaxID=29388 RepID=UPI000BFB5645|nr:metal-dependent transcriptional regulator [Staphylococcus capitis]ATN03459.1 DtxR family transcriptional regulator [Staphylococcus capitis]